MENITYNEFIQNILNTRGRFGCGDEYCERHHIIPRCLGGIDEEKNLIDLFAKEHFIAHRLLANENPDNDKLIYAWWMMARVERPGQSRYILTPEEYEEAKIAFCQTHKSAMLGENNPTKREDVRAKISQSLMGHPVSDEVREKLRLKFTGMKLSTERIQQIKQWMQDPSHCSNYGKHLSEDTKSKLGKQIYQCDINGRYISVWPYVTPASNHTGVDKSSIIKCCRGKLKTAGNFKWYYLYDQITKDGSIIQGAISLNLITEVEALAQLQAQLNELKEDDEI